MQTSERKTPLLIRLQRRLAQARFLTFSALIHTVLIVIGGGVILFEHKPEPPDFTSDGGTLVATEPEVKAPDEPVAPVTPTEQPAAPTPTLTPLSLDTIVTNAPAAFTLTNAAKLPTASPSNDMGQAVRDTLGKVGKTLGGSRPGGVAKFFGEKEKTVNGFTGTFYDTKQSRSRKPTGVTVDDYSKIVSKFVKENFRESTLNDYFKAPGTLSATQIFIPNMSADEGPKAFEMEKTVEPSRWLVHYRGKVSPPQDGTYRFVGAGDDYLVVRFNGKVVLDHGFARATDWEADRYYDYGWTGVPRGFARGEKMRVKAGQFYDMEILIGERPGGLVFFCLMLEEENVEYRRDARGNPILPVFRLADGPFAELEKGQTLPPYETAGPVWKAAPMKAGGGSGLDELAAGKQVRMGE